MGLSVADKLAVNKHKPDAKLINVRRGEGGAEWLGGPLWSPAVPLLHPMMSDAGWGTSTSVPPRLRRGERVWGGWVGLYGRPPSLSLPFYL